MTGSELASMGGKACAAQMTQEQRTQRARAAALTRWGKHKEKERMQTVKHNSVPSVKFCDIEQYEWFIKNGFLMLKVDSKNAMLFDNGRNPFLTTLEITDLCEMADVEINVKRR